MNMHLTYYLAGAVISAYFVISWYFLKAVYKMVKGKELDQLERTVGILGFPWFMISAITALLKEVL